MRMLGDILLDMEKILDEMVDTHELQFGDILALVHSHLLVHRPDAQEVYTADNSSPEFKYGPRRNRKNVKGKLVKLLKTWENSMLEGKTADEILDLIDKEYK